jgi:radical SAM protein with 4Fe4S-binding SPASM domain
MIDINTIEIQDLSLWEKKAAHPRSLYAFELELTARCNNNCRHCYINLPANDQEAKAQELTLAEIEDIADQAVDLGALWVLLTGGEPLLRPDFPEIYLMLKRKGLLVSVFTNATLVNPTHIELFKRYPPRDIEVTIYGVSQASYEAVTRLPGSYAAFRRGLQLLFETGVRIRLKAMVLHSNLHEIDAMAAFGRQYTKDYYRFDPLLHLRFDGDPQRNADIISERLTPEEVVALEQRDPERFAAMEKNCDNLINEDLTHISGNHLLLCGAGNGSFAVGYDGTFRLCFSLWAPGTTVNLRQVSLREAWEKWVPAVRDLRSDNLRFLETCRKCPLVNLCLWCPAHAYLETGAMDGETPYFCQVAHARATALQAKMSQSRQETTDAD